MNEIYKLATEETNKVTRDFVVNPKTLRIVSKDGTAAGTKIYIGDSDVELCGVTDLTLNINAASNMVTATLTIIVPEYDITVIPGGITTIKDDTLITKFDS